MKQILKFCRIQQYTYNCCSCNFLNSLWLQTVKLFFYFQNLGCGYCKKLKPDYAQAATALKGKAVSIFNFMNSDEINILCFLTYFFITFRCWLVWTSTNLMPLMFVISLISQASLPLFILSKLKTMDQYSAKHKMSD